MLEKPGVSTSFPPKRFTSSTCLVVCFPLPSAIDTSPTSKLRVVSSLLKRVDLPAPV